VSLHVALDALNILNLVVFSALFAWLRKRRNWDLEQWEAWLNGHHVFNQQPEAKRCGPPRPKTGS
jgi:hypothetical protein